MFMTDHNPLDGGTTGPRRPIEYRFGFWPMMYVWPQETEAAEIVARGPFRKVEGPFEWPYFGGGYGVVYMRADDPSAPSRNYEKYLDPAASLGA